MASLDNVLANIPGLGGYLAMEQYKQQQALGGLQGALGVLNAVRAHEEAQQQAQLRPLQMQLLQAQIGEHQQRVADAKRKSAFYSPENMAQFMTPGSPGEAPGQGQTGGIDDGAMGQIMAPKQATLPQLDLNRLVNAGAAAGVIAPETLLNNQSQIAARREQIAANYEARMAQIQAQTQAAAATAQNAADRNAILAQGQQMMHEARMAAIEARNAAGGGNKPPPGYRWTADGNQEVIPGGPADVKAQAAAQRQADGAVDVDVALTALRDAYNRLEKGGGITSTEKGPLSNLSASLSSSAAGQMAGKAFGTQNQSARNDILMARPALLAALMKATGMNARQMDSNAELKLWLSTATDPTLDVEANRKALNNIEQKYLRKPQASSGTTTSGDGPPPGIDPKLWKVMTPEERKLWQK